MTEQKKDAYAGFIAHLIELRHRLILASVGVVLVCLALFVWPGPAQIYDILAAPMMAALPQGTKMIATGVVSPFLVPMKITFSIALIIAMPWVLYQVWAFVAPGLYAHEKKWVIPLVVSSSILFLLGVLFSYFFVFGRVFQFISEFAPHSIMVAPDIESYLDFVITLCLAFGVTFEIPVIVVLSVWMGWVTVERLRSWRSYVIVGAFVVAAVVTPPDIFSQFALAVPMCILFELGLWVAALLVKSKKISS
jgi:sec-independent protein translocase protein TatC